MIFYDLKKAFLVSDNLSFDQVVKEIQWQLGISGEITLKYFGKIGSLQISIPVKNGTHGCIIL